MDKLEQYLDRVCLSIGGPKALRRHVRQELREHLLDAVAERKAAGLSEEEAITRALADFGGPEEVRSELEATHGHRLMPVVIDKAMQWKEMTMKAKWLWTTLVHLVLTCIIVLETIFVSFCWIYLVPKFQKIEHDVGPVRLSQAESMASWMHWFILGFPNWLADHLLWLVTPLAAIWGLFEWRVRSENKTLMRLSALGTVALGLAVVITLSIGSLGVLWALIAPAAEKSGGNQVFADLTATVNTSVGAIEQAMAQKEWGKIQEHATIAAHTMETLGRLEKKGVLYFTGLNRDDLKAAFNSAKVSMVEAEQAARKKDAGQMEAAMQKFRKSYEPVREWATANLPKAKEKR